MGQTNGYQSVTSPMQMNSSGAYMQQNPMYNNSGNFQNVQQASYQQMNMQNRQQITQRQAMPNGVAQPTIERTPATALMGFPGEIRQITNPKTQQPELVQTQMIEVELQSNKWGYGINLNDSDGVVRIEGKRANSDGTPSPAQQNTNIEKGDVIYKVQNVVLGRNNPLNVAVTTMQQSNAVKLTLLRHVPLSATETSTN